MQICISLLLKFRVHPIVLTADTEKAYLQINIDEEHRDYSRFLWDRNLQEESIIKYRNTLYDFALFKCYVVLYTCTSTRGAIL